LLGRKTKYPVNNNSKSESQRLFTQNY